MRIKKIFTFGLAIYFAAIAGFMFLEPELTRAATVAVSLSVTTEITVSCDSTAALSGVINAISGGSATGNFSCTVTTPDTKGYSLKVKENHTLYNGSAGANREFTDYATGTPLAYDFGTIGAGNEVFGFSLDSTTVSPIQQYQNNGGSPCNVAGSATTNHCWNGFTSSDQEISNKAAAVGSGELTKVNLRAEAGGTNALLPGTYSNTVTATATINP